MKKSKLIFLFFLFCSIFSPAQDQKFAVVFYNTENLFDWKDDPLTEDDEFTPRGDRHWTYSKFQQKIDNTAKVILNAAEWDVPIVIGLCEIENRDVLERLINTTVLKNIPFKIIHKESPDPRGIDVAMLYNSSVFYPLGYEYIPFSEADGSTRKTREILHVSGIVAEQDTIHLFMNHWPSRYSGLLETRPLRNRAADILRQRVDSVLKINPAAKIVIMGDFNDQPSDESLEKHLVSKMKGGSLINLSTGWMNADIGTLKYQSQWFVFDQIIVSSGLLETDAGIYTESAWAKIINSGFLLETDDRYGGLKPFRTYVGYSYNGGFGDHLPVKLQLGIR